MLKIQFFFNESKMMYLDMSAHACINGTAMYKNFVNYHEKILNLHVYDDDVWVMSFPKSGTTWTQEMVWLLANNLDYNAAQQDLYERFPFLEMTGVSPLLNAATKPEISLPFELHEDSVSYIEKLKRPRFIKTHLAWEFLPLQIQDGRRKPKIVYVARNPKDVCVSYYYHTRTFHGFGGTLEDFCDFFLTDKVPYSPYWNNVLGRWNRRNEDNIIFIKYEDMKADMPSVLNKVARFFGTHLNEEEVDKLNGHLSFEAMKKNNAVNNKEVEAFFKQNSLSPFTGDFFRRGVAGGYKSEMKEATVGRFDEWIERNTAGTGLNFTC